MERTNEQLCTRLWCIYYTCQVTDGSILRLIFRECTEYRSVYGYLIYISRIRRIITCLWNLNYYILASIIILNTLVIYNIFNKSKKHYVYSAVSNMSLKVKFTYTKTIIEKRCIVYIVNKWLGVIFLFVYLISHIRAYINNYYSYHNQWFFDIVHFYVNINVLFYIYPRFFWYILQYLSSTILNSVFLNDL